jgi:hypothetical protein
MKFSPESKNSPAAVPVLEGGNLKEMDRFQHGANQDLVKKKG